MKVECSECKTNYNIDDNKVPTVGAKIKCPKCQNIIYVSKSEPAQPPLSVPRPSEMDIPKNKKPEPNISKKSKAKMPNKLIIALASLVVLALIWHFSGAPMMGTGAHPGKAEATNQEYTPLKSDSARNDNFAIFVKFLDNNINWNIAPKNLPNILLQHKEANYKWSMYSDNNVKDLEYLFFQNSLCAVVVEISDTKQAKKMIDIIDNKFGVGEKQSNGTMKWNLNDISIETNPASTGRYFAVSHNETIKAKEKYTIKILLQQNNFASNDHILDFVKNGHLRNYQNKTIGETIDSLLSDVNWKVTIGDSETLIVDMTGMLTDDIQNTGRQARIKLQFSVSKSDKNIEIYAAKFEGNSISGQGIPGFLEFIFNYESFKKTQKERLNSKEYKSAAACSRMETEANAAIAFLASFFADPSRFNVPTLEELKEAEGYEPILPVEIIGSSYDDISVLITDPSELCVKGSRYIVSSGDEGKWIN